jgi:hypothetical protein
MEGTLAYTISAAIVGFGIWVFVDGLNSGAPILLACAALIPRLNRPCERIRRSLRAPGDSGHEAAGQIPIDFVSAV